MKAAKTHPLANLPERSPALEPLLDPGRLTQTAEDAARALLREGESTNTRASYASAMRYWCAWYAARYGDALQLPVSVPVVIQFIVDHAARTAAAEGAPSSRACLVTELPADIDQALVANGYKARLGAPALNTLVHRIAVLSKAHQLAKAPNPCADPLVRELLAQTRRAYAKRGARPRKQRALTKDPLQAVLATCDDTLRGKRDRALLLFAWATGGRRRSEVASATLKNLQRVDANSYLYTLAHSKTNQAGAQRPDDVKPLAGSAAQAMQAWLAVLAERGIQEGALFRRIRKGGHLGEPLAPAAVRDIVKERCALAGVEGSFSAHSLRAGFVTEAGRQNMSLPETMAMTGHQSVATVMGYFRAESALGSKVSRMLDEQ
ncbi:integrase [Variovorax sp. WS11]|uniref:site-specific integrase n=1 Tax=Variovorax sp. WS11 TaxID=1105204 RepID=UPI000D0D5A4E|nr:site-specific integrase [Variovorax sp. WS11]NDZ17773.1 site-specific integrase [Variovorax sp. WS11]PSL80187.1 integrase [Variovorax sp. WS11]